MRELPKKTIYDLSNCYTAAQAASVLGLTVKRVRQLLAEGKLTTVSRDPILIEQVEVVALRTERETQGKAVRRVSGEKQSLEAIEKLLQAVTESNRRALEAVTEAHRIVEESQAAEIFRLRAELEQALKSRRGIFRRR